MRTNIYKEKIIGLLKKNHLLSITDIHKAIPKADYSTVYRNIEQLLDDKKIKKVLIDNKTSVYELVHENDHDHFVCDDCGDISEIEVSRKKLGISLPISDITIRGLCNNCKEV